MRFSTPVVDQESPSIDLRDALPRSRRPPRSQVHRDRTSSLGTSPPHVDFRTFQPPKPPSPSKHSAGVLARADHVAAKKHQKAFLTEVVRPMQQLLDYLHDKCITCILRESPNWDNHNYDCCQHSEAVHFRDGQFQNFKEAFKKLPHGWCWHCIRHQKHFNHKAVASGELCRDIGHLLRLAYAYHSLKCSSLDGYPQAPSNLADLREDLPAFVNWAIALVKPQPYDGGMSFINLHHLLLWVMEKNGILRQALSV